jgi:hypothetical protein
VAARLGCVVEHLGGLQEDIRQVVQEPQCVCSW